MSVGRRPEVPKTAHPIQSYDRLAQYFHAFGSGQFNLLVVIGRPGIGKSQELRRMANRVHIIRGELAPIYIYRELYHHRNQPLALDDAHFLTGMGQGLLRDLTQTDAVKTMEWHSDNRSLQKEEVPTRFKTRSKVCILTNKFFGGNPEAKALEDRGHLLHFNPTNEEVHRHVSTWYWDQEIFDYIQSRLHSIESLTCRLYVKAKELKNSSINWREHIADHFISDKELLVQESLTWKGKKMERIARWQEATGMSEREYYYLLSRLEERGQAQPLALPKIKLTCKAPPQSGEDEDDVPQLRLAG
jgi:hypothetical protein